eukprot:GILJ01018590.1.p2 GENE.GILJ01018590.1~~GILJ01018590.1.p2  ORF type:complete len:126 (-),score=8.62 GILJ01018590.1:132-509(-)
MLNLTPAVPSASATLMRLLDDTKSEKDLGLLKGRWSEVTESDTIADFLHENGDSFDARPSAIRHLCKLRMHLMRRRAHDDSTADLYELVESAKAALALLQLAIPAAAQPVVVTRTFARCQKRERE